jgi:hypothetical protein
MSTQSTAEQSAQEMSNVVLSSKLTRLSWEHKSVETHETLQEAARRLRAIDTEKRTQLAAITEGLDLEEMLVQIDSDRVFATGLKAERMSARYNQIHQLLTRLKAMEARTTT